MRVSGADCHGFLLSILSFKTFFSSQNYTIKLFQSFHLSLSLSLSLELFLIFCPCILFYSICILLLLSTLSSSGREKSLFYPSSPFTNIPFKKVISAKTMSHDLCLSSLSLILFLLVVILQFNGSESLRRCNTCGKFLIVNFHHFLYVSFSATDSYKLIFILSFYVSNISVKSLMNQLSTHSLSLSPSLSLSSPFPSFETGVQRLSAEADFRAVKLSWGYLYAQEPPAFRVKYCEVIEHDTPLNDS